MRITDEQPNGTTEVVLSVLLSKFRFASSGKEIAWAMYDLATPGEKGDGMTPAMPMKIILL